MKRIGAALVLVLSLLVAQPAEATPPDFAITDCPGMSDSVLRLYTAGLGRSRLFEILSSQRMTQKKQLII